MITPKRGCLEPGRVFPNSARGAAPSKSGGENPTGMRMSTRRRHGRSFPRRPKPRRARWAPGPEVMLGAVWAKRTTHVSTTGFPLKDPQRIQIWMRSRFSSILFGKERVSHFFLTRPGGDVTASDADTCDLASGESFVFVSSYFSSPCFFVLFCFLFSLFFLPGILWTVVGSYLLPSSGKSQGDSDQRRCRIFLGSDNHGKCAIVCRQNLIGNREANVAERCGKWAG